MFHSVVNKLLREPTVPYGTGLDTLSETSGQTEHVLALYPHVIRTQDEYSVIRQAVIGTGFDMPVHYCVLVTPGNQSPEKYVVIGSWELPCDINEARALGAKYDSARAHMNREGLSISQLTLPHDTRRAWVVDQLERVYAASGVSRSTIEKFLTGALPVITVAVYDEKIVAAGMAKVTTGSKKGIWNYINVLGPVATQPHNNREWYPAVWGEMVHELVRKFFVS